jgi:hypothetical protein
MGLGQLGLMWWYISEIVRETGQNSIMPMFSKIISHKTRNKQTWRQELEELIKSIRTLVSQYPTAEDNTRLGQEFETYAVVSSLSNIPEFETHFQQTVYHLRQWPTGPQIVDSISNLADSMLKLQSDFNNGEVLANAASSDSRNYEKGPCFNCGGKHFSRDCTRTPSICNICKREGHLAEYCNRIQSHNSSYADKKRETIHN